MFKVIRSDIKSRLQLRIRIASNNNKQYNTMQESVCMC